MSSLRHMMRESSFHQGIIFTNEWIVFACVFVVSGRAVWGAVRVLTELSFVQRPYQAEEPGVH